MTRALFAISLILNALLIGFIFGDFARPIRAAQSIGSLSSHYPDEIRSVLRAKVIAERETLKADFAKFNATRAEMFAEMRAPEPDRAKIEASMAMIRAQTTDLQARLQSETLDAVLAAPAEVRAEIETPLAAGRWFGE